MRRLLSASLLVCAALIAPRAALPDTLRASGPARPVTPVPELKPGRRDPLVAMVRRVDRFLRKNAVGGITPDSRWVLNPTETARLTATASCWATPS